MTPEVEAYLRATVASLRVKTSCQDLLSLALLPMLQHHQKEAVRERLDAIEQGEVERETAIWISTMRQALEE